MEELLSVHEASMLVKLKPATLYSYAEKKLIPHTKLGSRLFFQRRSLESWVADNTFVPEKRRTIPEGIYQDGAGA